MGYKYAHMCQGALPTISNGTEDDNDGQFMTA